MNTVLYRTAREMIADLAAKKISARELLDAHVARKDALHKKLNAVVATDLERARRDADAIDQARAKGETLGPLAGLPMTIKDGYDVENMPATSGNPVYARRDKNCVDADVVKSVRAAGAVVWGKTNVPLMLGDFQSYNDVYGTTNNPYDVTRTPGGSSGGAAASLAAGITPLEIGSDIGGSLRHPANFCGVCSLKPTWGVLSSRGQIPPPPGLYSENDLGVVGPMARNTGDLRLLWNVLRGHAGASPRPIKGARVAVWDEEPGFPLSRDAKAGVAGAANALADAGVEVERRRPPIDGQQLMEVYLGLLTPIVSAGLPEAMLQSFEAQRSDDLAARRNGIGMFSMAAYRLRATASHREVLDLMTRRQAMKDRLDSFFAEGWQAILSPISVMPAFPHLHQPGFNERTLDMDGESVPYGTMLCWIALATALLGPSLAVPAGQTASGLPTGVQLMGPSGGEDRLFDFGGAIEERLGGFRPPAL
ncbi:MAG TPA: amidase family protein [Rhizomicrobium sp.]|nr:amidase family protein [Rhizomicrobium sp.]